MRLHLRSRDELLSASSNSGGETLVVDMQSELRQSLLDCLRIAPTVTMRQNDGLKDSMEELLRECKADSKYDAAAGVQKVRAPAFSPPDLRGDTHAAMTAGHPMHSRFLATALGFERRRGVAGPRADDEERHS